MSMRKLGFAYADLAILVLSLVVTLCLIAAFLASILGDKPLYAIAFAVWYVAHSLDGRTRK